MELSKAIEVSSTREEYTVADRGASWYHEPISVDPEEVYCLVQRWFFLHTGRNCSAGTIHGFKEVRYAERWQPRLTCSLYFLQMQLIVTKTLNLSR